MKRKNEWIEALRGILILLIVLYHFTSRYLDFYPDVKFPFVLECGGSLGNVMFFIISGYFATHSLLCNDTGIQSYFKFCINKWWRFFPAIVISTTFIYLFIYLFDAYFIEERKVSFLSYILNWLIIHPSIPYVDGAHWFLASLLTINFIVGAILLFKPSIRVYLILILGILAFFISFDIPDTKIDNVISVIMCGREWFVIYLSGCIIFLPKIRKQSQWQSQLQ